MRITLANLTGFKLNRYENDGSLKQESKHGVNFIKTAYEQTIHGTTLKITLTATEFEADLSQDLTIEYDAISNSKNEIHFEHTYYLEEYSNIDDLEYDLNCWIVDAESDMWRILLDDGEEPYDSSDNEEDTVSLCIPEAPAIHIPYSAKTVEAAAKLMNDFGLSFATTAENESPDLRRKPPFTTDDIIDWLREAEFIIRKRYDEDALDDEAYTEYTNGPIDVKAYKDGAVELSIVLCSDYKAGNQS